MSTILHAEDESPRQLADQLVAAAARGDWEALHAALARNVDVNAVSDGTTAWSAARRNGFQQIAELLEQRGANTSLVTETWQQRYDRSLTGKYGETTSACVVLVAQDGNVIYEQAFGMARLDQPQAASVSTRFRIGSVTKQFVSAAILKLQEDGKLSVDDPLSKYVSGFARGDDIKLRHLLTHTSGLVNYTAKPEFMTQVTLETSDEAVIESFRSDELEFNPGEKYAYCNSGYFLLGQIVAQVAELPLDEFLRKSFFEPLGMSATEIHQPARSREGDAIGYSARDGVLSPAIDWHMSHAGGAGALISNVHDLYLWNEALFSGKVLNDQSLAMALAPTKLNDGSESPYGFGWVISDQRGLKLISHTGGLDGFSSYAGRFPDSRVSIIVLGNAAPAGDLPMPASIAAQLGQEVLWPLMKERLVRVIDTRVSRETIAQFVGRYDYGGGIVLEVTLEGDQLFAQLTGQGRHPIYAANESTCFWKVVDAEVEFLRDEAGQVHKLIHRQGGQQAEHARLVSVERVALSDEQLDRFVGRYDYGSAVMTITRQEHRLIAQLSGQEPYEISPSSETKFRWTIVEAEIEFKLKDGEVVGATHRQGGRTFDAARMEPLMPIELTEQQLDEYVGQYNYGFLAGRMTVSRQGKALFSKLRGQPSLMIVPVAADRFQWRDVNASVQFERDENGRVVRAVHHQGGRSFDAPRVE